MNKEDLIRKLTSRKFWTAIAMLAFGIVYLFTRADNTAKEIAALVEILGVAVGYIIGEGLSDGAPVTFEIGTYHGAQLEEPEVYDDQE